MALVVHHGNRTEKLLDVLACDMRGRDPLVPLDLVVPNANMATYVKLGLAERLGIAANIRVLFMERYVREIVRRTSLDLRIVERSELRDLILTLLLDDRELAQPVMEPVRAWLRGGDVDARRVELAGRLSGLMQEYTFSRPEMMARFKDGSEDGGWQGWMWQRMFGQGGIAKERSARKQETWITVAEVFDRIDPEAFGGLLALHVFGLSYMARAFHFLLATLGRTIEVRVYVLNACPALAGKEGGSSCHAAQGWSRPGQESLRLMCAQPGVRAEPHYVDPLDDGDTLLHRVQSGIVRPDGTARTGRCEADGTIELVACKGTRREVESVSDRIWSAVRRDISLRFNQIAVIVNPAQRDQYMPHVQAAFAENHFIPYNVVDLDMAATSPVAEAVLMLLNLPLGSFTRSEVGRLLVHPAFAGASLELDADTVMRLCEDLGIYRGADRSDLEGTYVEEDLHTWDQGLRRLALGAFMTGPRSGDDSPCEAGADAYAVHEMAQSGARDAARFAMLARSLIADASRARHALLSTGEWSRLFEHMIGAYIADPKEGSGDLFWCLNAVRSLARTDLGDTPVSFSLASSLVRAAIASAGGSLGQHLADGVVVSTFVPMRAIPFRVVFLLGMGEGLFPSCDARDDLDLRGTSARPGDVTPSERDRYTLLETLLGARDRLSVSWVARDATTGDTLAPSPVLVELASLCEPHLPGTADAIRTEEPVRRHDPCYVPGQAACGEPRFTEIDAARKEARLRCLGDDLRRHAGRLDAAEDIHGVLAALDPGARETLRSLLGMPSVPRSFTVTPDGVMDISLASVRRFLECPLQGWASAVLRLGDASPADKLTTDVEPFETDRLLSTTLTRESLIDSIDTGRDLASVHAERARMARLQGRYPTGVFGRVQLASQLAVAGMWATALSEMLDGMPEQMEVVRVGRAEQHARVNRIEPPIALVVPSREGFVRVRLSGRTEPLAAGRLASVTLLSRSPFLPSHVLFRYQLRGWMDHLALAALGLITRQERQAIVIATDGNKRMSRSLALPALSKDEALGQLAAIVTDLIQGVHDYLMPCEAVSLWASGSQPTIKAAVSHLLSDSWHRFGSQYGPVPHPERYDVPDDASAGEMVSRRFGALIAADPGVEP